MVMVIGILPAATVTAAQLLMRQGEIILLETRRRAAG
jgi:hypothetical protein